MFSVLMFMSRDLGDDASKVSCCVNSSKRSKSSETTVIIKSASFVIIMLLHKGLTHIQSQLKPWLLFGESFALSQQK